MQKDILFLQSVKKTHIVLCIRMNGCLIRRKIQRWRFDEIEDFGKAEEVIRRNRYFEKYTESAVFQDSEQFIEGGAR